MLKEGDGRCISGGRQNSTREFISSAMAPVRVSKFLVHAFHIRYLSMKHHRRNMIGPGLKISFQFSAGRSTCSSSGNSSPIEQVRRYSSSAVFRGQLVLILEIVSDSELNGFTQRHSSLQDEYL